MDELLKRQYACGAQPNHVGSGRHSLSPAQPYRCLTANLMLDLGQQLKREDAIDYVRRFPDFSLLATNRHGEAFCSSFIGLNKSRSLGCAGRQWVMAIALGDERFRGLARTTYELWVPKALEFGPVNDDHKPSGIHVPRFNLNEALYLGIKHVPEAKYFAPPSGLHSLPDISTVFVHEIWTTPVEFPL